MNLRRGDRVARYGRLAAGIASMDDRRLLRILARAHGSRGWGTTWTIRLGEDPVFVKAIPITELELERPWSTRNHYRLPVFYNYGVGSAGFGAWRELVTHLKTTAWVLAGETELFPLTYHHRIMDIAATVPLEPDRLARYARAWNGSRAIGRYTTDRAASPRSVVVFMEHLPHAMSDRFASHPGSIERLVESMREAVLFMHSKGVRHLDANSSNVMTDGRRAYLVDFGLALDEAFDLTAREREFFDSHANYDLGEVAYSPGAALVSWYRSLASRDQVPVLRVLGATPDQFGAGESGWVALLEALVDGLDELETLPRPRIPAGLLRAARRFGAASVLMSRFFAELRANRRKDTQLDHVALRRMVDAAWPPPARL